VIGFQCTGRCEDVLGMVFVEIVGQEHEHWPDTLSSEREHIANGRIKTGWATVVGQTVKIVVDKAEDFVGC
jgi:hypothetical protein